MSTQDNTEQSEEERVIVMGLYDEEPISYLWIAVSIVGTIALYNHAYDTFMNDDMNGEMYAMLQFWPGVISLVFTVVMGYLPLAHAFLGGEGCHAGEHNAMLDGMIVGLPTCILACAGMFFVDTVLYDQVITYLTYGATAYIMYNVFHRIGPIQFALYMVMGFFAIIFVRNLKGD